MKGSWTPVALAIPVFFLFIGIEAWVAWRSQRHVYRSGDVVADLGCGVFQQLVSLFARTLLAAGYLGVYASFRFHEWASNSVVTWLVAFVLVDFCYYWFHRTSHGVSFMWAAHVVHHQSEDYNLAVALRQGAAQAFFSWAFYLPLALLGIPPIVYFTCHALNTLYQFWIHTRLVGRLGPVEWVMNTPSHHRVHHGRDPKYIDKNHAGTFIVWDRLFGTFQAEEEEPTYGITHAVNSFDPIRSHIKPWQELLHRSRCARGWDRFWVWLKEPGWTPEGVTWAPAKPLDAPKYEPSVSAGTGRYALIQFAPLVPLTMALIYVRASGPFDIKLLTAGFAVWTLVSLAGAVEARAWAVRSEGVRLSCLPLVAVVFCRSFGFPGEVPVLLALTFTVLGFVLRLPFARIPRMG